MSFLISLVNIIFIASLIYLLREKGVLRNVYWAVAFLKIIAGLVLGLIYFKYYGVGDTLNFAVDARVLSSVARNDFGTYVSFLLDESAHPDIIGQLLLQDYRSMLMTKIVSVFAIVSSNNYWIMSTYCSVLSFFGTMFFLKSVNVARPQATATVIVAICFPSVVFWSSGLIKESLAMAGLFFLAGVFIRLWERIRIRWLEIVIGLVASWLTWKLKYYYAGVFFVVTIPFLVYHLFLRRKVAHQPLFVRAFLLASLLIIPVVIASNAHPNFRPARLFAVIVENYDAFLAFSSPTDVVHYNGLEPDAFSILTNVPSAVIAGLFRPVFWEANNAIQFLVSIENLVLMLLSILALFQLKQGLKPRDRLLILAILSYVLILCIFIALSTPNFGTMSRYKVSYMPYFIILLLSNPICQPFLEKTYRSIVRNGL